MRAAVRAAAQSAQPVSAAAAVPRLAAPAHQRRPRRRRKPRAGGVHGAGIHPRHRQHRRHGASHSHGRAGRGVLDVGGGAAGDGREVCGNRPVGRDAQARRRGVFGRADVLYRLAGRKIPSARADVRAARGALRLRHRQSLADKQRRGSGGRCCGEDCTGA